MLLRQSAAGWPTLQGMIVVDTLMSLQNSPCSTCCNACCKTRVHACTRRWKRVASCKGNLDIMIFMNQDGFHLSSLRWPNKPLDGAPAQALAEGARCLPQHRLLKLQQFRHMPSIRTHSRYGAWSTLAASQSGSDPACTRCLAPHAVQGQAEEISTSAHALASPAADAPACQAASNSQ